MFQWDVFKDFASFDGILFGPFCNFRFLDFKPAKYCIMGDVLKLKEDKRNRKGQGRSDRRGGPERSDRREGPGRSDRREVPVLSDRREVPGRSDRREGPGLSDRRDQLADDHFKKSACDEK